MFFFKTELLYFDTKLQQVEMKLILLTRIIETSEFVEK